MTEAIVVREDTLSLDDVVGQVMLIQRVMETVMKKDEHYGIIPGCKKPSLLKAGAEKLCLTFRLAPTYKVVETRDGDHLTIMSECTLTHITTGRVMGSGLGSCSTKETKYAYRDGGRKCPKCGTEAIIKGKEEFGGGWLCFKKKGGCGEKFADGDQSVEAQTTGRVINPDLADCYNTVLKMAAKRSQTAGVLTVTAASDLFAQDAEDMPVPALGRIVDVKAEPQDDPAKTAPSGAATSAGGGTVNPNGGGHISDPQRKRMYAIGKSKGWTTDQMQMLVESYGFESSSAVTRHRYEEICKKLETGKAIADDQSMIPEGVLDGSN